MRKNHCQVNSCSAVEWWVLVRGGGGGGWGQRRRAFPSWPPSPNMVLGTTTRRVQHPRMRMPATVEAHQPGRSGVRTLPPPPSDALARVRSSPIPAIMGEFKLSPNRRGRRSALVWASSSPGHRARQEGSAERLASVEQLGPGGAAARRRGAPASSSPRCMPRPTGWKALARSAVRVGPPNHVQDVLESIHRKN